MCPIKYAPWGESRICMACSGKYSSLTYGCFSLLPSQALLAIVDTVEPLDSRLH